MMKWRNLIVTVLVAAFIALNAYLVFSEKSIIDKTVYVGGYERLAAGDFKEELHKEGIIAPKDLHTLYLKDGQTIDTWLVQEGESIELGTELASLKTDDTDRERTQLQSELTALQDQASTISATIRDLEYDQRTSTGTTGRSDYYDSNDENRVRVNLNVGVNIDSDSTYAQAIAAAERDLAKVQRETAVVESKIAQLPDDTALTSPVSGFVMKIHRNEDKPSIDIFSTDQTILTYVTEEEWTDIEPGDLTVIQHAKIRVPFYSKHEQADDEQLDGFGSAKTKKIAADSADGAITNPEQYVDDEGNRPVNKTGEPGENFDGTSGNPDGSMDNPDGTITKPDGTIEVPEPSNSQPDTSIPDGGELDTTNDSIPDGGIIDNPENGTDADDSLTNPNGGTNGTPVEMPTAHEKRLAETRERIQPNYPSEITAITGVVVSVSKVQAKDDKWLKSYKSLDSAADDSKSYYAVRIAPQDEQLELPFGTNMNTLIQTDDAFQAVSLKTNWLHDRYDNEAAIWTLDYSGKAVKQQITTPFTSLGRSVITSGAEQGTIALHTDKLEYTAEPQPVFHPLPAYLPEWNEWKETGWRNYARYLLKR